MRLGVSHSRGRGAASIVAAAALGALGTEGVLQRGQAGPFSLGHSAVTADTTITIRTTGSALEFVPSRIAVRQRTRVRLVYVNEGTLPHNLVLLWDWDDIDALGRAALDAAATGYVPLQRRDRLIGYSGLAAPGETVHVEFEVPAPGEYPYVCLYAGHYNMMIGTLRSLR